MFIALKRIFLSTLSLRRATRGLLHHTRQAKYFYPRSPCGERHCHFNALCSHNLISIHALLAESDAGSLAAMQASFKFLSTLSLRRATINLRQCLGAPGISIHALLAESDCCTDLNPWLSTLFLSTLSLRRATCGSSA